MQEPREDFEMTGDAAARSSAHVSKRPARRERSRL
jgi:hypothetical protein